MMLDSPVVFAYCATIVAVFGLCMGSFVNCMAWRVTHGESVMHGRSHCTTCGHELGILDLIPVLSWVFSRGRCRYCGEHVSGRYPITEIVSGVAYVSVFLVYGLSLETIELCVFCSALLALSLIDLDSLIIPNSIILFCIAVRAAYIVAVGVTGQGDVLPLVRDTLIGGFAVAVPLLLLSLVMDRVLGRDSLGGGDLKLLFVAGLYFGWMQCLFLVLVACVVGLVAGPLLRGRSKPEDADPKSFPFGPAIAIACWICMLAGGPVVSWYLNMFLN